MVRISICVPVYGVENYIERCAESLFKQTYENIEYIFINDCTKDKSIDILNEVIKRYPQREKDIQIINNEYNLGIGAVRNRAIELCTSDFVMYVDSDDYLDEDAVELAIKEQSSSNADIVRFGIYREKINKTSILLPKQYNNQKQYCLDLLSRSVTIALWGGVYRKSLFIENKIKINEGVNMSEDYQITPQLAYYANKISFIQKPLYHYSLTNVNSYTHKISEEHINQVDHTLNILRLFFKNKGKEYEIALDAGEYKILIGRLKNTSQDKKLKAFYLQSKCRIKKIPFNHIKKIPFYYRIISFLPNYSFVRFYIKITSLLKLI